MPMHELSTANRVLRILIAFLFLLSSAGTAVFSATTKNEGSSPRGNEVSREKRSRIAVPILYLTDRQLDDKLNYGVKRKYIIDCKHDMYYGTADVVTNDYKHKLSEKLSTELKWRPEDKRKIGEVNCDKISTGSPEQDKEEFFKRLEAMLEATGSDRVCLYVHGAEDAFNDCASDAASLAYSLEYPLILYSWPSNPKSTRYFVDDTNNEWSQGHFNLFINDLIEFDKKRKIELSIVSHSMGNRLVVRSVPNLRHSQFVTDAELVSPDIDAETFKHYVMGLRDRRSIIRLYSSTHDKMLALSQMLHGGYYRLGEGVGTVFSGMGHSPKQPADDGNVKRSSESVNSQSADVHQQGLFERIDFTDLDEGFSGHSIPFDMLASMIKTNEPGPGLTLEKVDPGKGSRLARYMSWRHFGSVKDVGDHDRCLKVVKVAGP